MSIDFDAIRAAHPLESVVGAQVQLKRAGGNKAGCCPFHADRTPSFVVFGDGHYHCFGCGAHGDVIDYVAAVEKVSVSEAIRSLTGGAAPAFTAEDRARRDAERKASDEKQRRREQEARQAAQSRWNRALAINGAGAQYLVRKNVAPYGCKREGESLLVPIFDAAGQILSVQSIPPEPGAKKLFHAGVRMAGGRYIIGDNPGDLEQPIVIVEGFATGATVQAATGHAVAIAFSKANLAAVASDLATRMPGRRILIGADSNGVAEAEAAAAKVGASVVVPELMGADGTDFNDQAAHYGLEDVEKLFADRVAAPVETPLPLVWFGDNQPFLSGNWLVKNVLPAEAFATIIGHPGCGKSFLALDMALHIAAGIDWQGRKVRRGLVLYLAAEGQRGQQNRVEAWKRHWQVNDLPFALIPVAINLRDREADLPKLFQTIEGALAIARARYGDLPLCSLVVDTLNRTFGGGDENGTDMSEYVDNVGRIKEAFGCTTIVVHHIPKNSETVSERGHGSLRGAIETSLVVSTDDTGNRTVLCKKQKDAEDGWKAPFRLKVIELGHDEDGDPVTSCVVVPDAADEAARASATSGKGPSLSPTQRQVYNELLAAMQAASVGVPADIPNDQLNRAIIGKVVLKTVWRDRWVAVGGGDRDLNVAHSTFRRAVTDLQNKRLIGVWNDHAWPLLS